MKKQNLKRFVGAVLVVATSAVVAGTSLTSLENLEGLDFTDRSKVASVAAGMSAEGYRKMCATAPKGALEIKYVEDVNGSHTYFVPVNADSAGFAHLFGTIEPAAKAYMKTVCPSWSYTVY